MREPVMADLERALTEVGARVEYPPTPSMTVAVTARLSAARDGGVRPPLPGLALWTRRRLLVAVAIGVLALLAIAAATRLVIGALEIRAVPTLPTSPTTAPLPEAIGQPVTLEDAREEVGFAVRLPAGAEPPDTVRTFPTPFGDRSVLLAWDDPGLPPLEGVPWTLVLLELPGDEEYAFKLVAGEGPVDEVEVGGRRAYWLDEPHVLVLETATDIQTYEVSGNVLAWDAGDGLVLRMETALPLPDAIALAETIA
ncbi:MAG TPA: hypothetical protein VFT27_08800 [Actinomycetota bacterium]|nr:hypothetical protein [Actinomycetota bacterium]